ncbi:MAG: prepilin-type N-terminal cleavage/methylation domain-containing protein [Chromatiales bacterium]
MRARSASRGFTLVELAIVLLVIALLLAGLLGPLSTRTESQERQRTQGQLENIKEALVGFAVANGRLPCPDSVGDDGTEDRTGTPPVCVAASGNLPWVDLNVGQRDEWGGAAGYRGFFRYRVTPLFAAGTNTAPCGTATATVAFELCSVGDITVLDAAGGATVVNQVPALIFSRGSNHNDAALAIGGTLSSHEQENEDPDAVFVSKSFSRDDTLEFDDLVTWISPNVLKNRMVMAGRLP